MEIHKKRILFLGKDKDDPVLQKLGKTYKGRFYQNLCKSYGWSFSIEHRDAIQSALPPMSDDRLLSHNDVSRDELDPSLSPDRGDETSSPRQTHPDQETYPPSYVLQKTMQDVSTQTELPISPKKGMTYRYDLPSDFFRQFEVYNHLKT